MNLEIIIRDKIARLVDTDKYFVCGNNDIDINFIFDEEWNAHETKTARFAFNGEHIDVIFTGNTVKSPIIKNAHLVEIGVYAGNLSTTTPAVLRTKRSILCNGGSPAAPTPDVYAQLMGRLNEIEANGGISGKDGKDGADGKDGVSVTHEWIGTTLQITSASGTSAVDLKGDPGKDGEKGDPGEPGADGKPGSDANVTSENIKNALGYTPANAADVSNLSSEKVDKNGITLGLYTDGKYYVFVDGKPVGSGFEMSTNSGDVFGFVDENNNIVLTGNLPDGAYSVAYEMENGSTVEIGDMVLDSNVYYSVTNNLTNCINSNSATQAVKGGSYTATISANSGYELSSVSVTMNGSPVTVSGGVINIASVTGDIVITAVAEETVNEPTYTNILTSGAYEIQLNKRWSNTTKGYTACNGMIAFLIPIDDVWNKTIRFKGFPANTSAGSSSPIWMTINSDNSKASSMRSTDGKGQIWTSTTLTDEGNGIYSQVVNSTAFPDGQGVQLAINMAFGSTAVSAIPDDAIMTIDEEIV